MEEIWKDVPGYESKYQASNLGRIRSLDRTFEHESMILNQHMITPILRKRTRKVIGRIKKQTKGNHGYYVVNLGYNDVKTVHTLVARAFFSDADFRLHVDHINSIRTDNNVNNLKFVTQQENNAKQRYTFGEEKHNSVLTENDVRHIRDEYFNGEPKRGLLSKIAKGYRLNIGVVRDVVRYNTWTHVR
jgi:hypothetical protein